MRTSLCIAFVLLALTACGSSCPESTTTTTTTTTSGGDMLRDPNPAPETMQVTIGGTDASGRFADAQVFSGFGCTGGNQSPALSWTAGPEGTLSYAIVMHDPDAPTGVGFFHWIAADLPPSTTSLAQGASSAEGAMPAGTVQGYTDFGGNGYGGPCPPPGPTHRYEISVYALDVASLGISAGATGALTRFMLNGHSLAIGRAQATWSR